MKKIISFVLCLLMVICFIASCSNTSESSSTSETLKPIETEKETETTGSNSTDLPDTSVVTEEVTTNEEKPEEPENAFFIQDPIEENFGSYLTLVYNPSLSDIEVEVKKGLGAKEEYTIRIKMKNDFIFSGFSYDKYISASKTPSAPFARGEECKFTLEEEKTVYCNYAMKLVYYAMGGKICGEDVYEETIDISTYRCPNTKPNKNDVVRDGYVLTGYNTKEDMSGDRVGVGSKYNFGTAVGKLYCIWEKASDESLFEYSKSGVACTIKKYTGDEEHIVVPQTIDGSRVTQIAPNAFEGSNMSHITLPTYITKVGAEAFKNCENLVKITCYDAIIQFDDTCIYGCPEFKTLEINTSYDMYDWWGTGTYVKYDRLLWAKDMKKIVIFGGSGSWYGWDSVYMNEQFGDEYVIINLGTNASMTNLFVMEFLTYYMNEGDILLWSPECGAKPLGTTVLTDGTNASTEREFSFCAYNYDNIALIDMSKYPKIFTNFAAYNQLHSTKTAPFTYSVQNINIYGDDVSTRVSQEKQYSYSFSSALSNKQTYKEMGNQILKMKENGVLTLYTFAVAQEGCAKDNVLDKYIQDMEEIFHVTSISDYHDLLYGISDFHDSGWHLVNEAAHRRTVSVCEDLKNYLEKE